MQPSIGKRSLAAAVFFLGVSLFVPRLAVPASPQDPAVKKCVERALGHLAASNDERLGAKCLVGLCFKKAEIDNHAQITKAVEACKDVSRLKTCDNYSLGIALMFLCEVDPKAHHDLIVTYVDEMFRRQKTFGAWSYENYVTGDTSQTQYAVLGMWMAKNYAAIDIPMDRVESTCSWLMRTQDPSGGWGYQGTDPGTLQRVPQTPVTGTLSASGAGSMYMLADLLQVTKRVDAPNAPKSKALQNVEEPGAKKDPRGPLTNTLKPEEIMSTLAAADQHLGKGYTQQEKWNHYYLYALERYHSFREKAGGVKDNKWYDQGFAYLQKTQAANGSFQFEGEGDRGDTATCFGVLFLLRSSEKTIVKHLKVLMGEGKLVAGMRLPKDIKSLDVSKDGKLIDRGISISTEQILELIGKGDNDDVARVADKREALELSSNKSDRDRQIEKLRRFVGAGDYNARLVAVMTLGKVRDLDNVPRLLYALTDKEPQIVLQADRALRFISRKVNGVGLPEADPTAAQIQAAQAAWKAWYLSIRPNAELLD